MGKARSFSNEANEIIYQTESNNENFAMGSQQNSYNLGSVHFSDQSGIGNFSQSGQNSKFVNLKGSTIQGNIGFVQQTVELDVVTSTINLNNDSTGAALAVISQDRIVTLSAGSTSDLTTITGAQRPGQRVTLYNIFSNTITIKNDAGATVNTIVTPGAVDFSLSGHGLVTLMFDVSLAQWRIEGNLGSGGDGTTLPVVDSTSIVKGSVDDTKLMRFEVDTLVPTTTTVVLTVPEADTILAGLSISPQTFSGITTFTGSSFSVTSAAIFLGDETSDTINVGGRIGTDLDPSSDVSSSLGSASLRWLDIFGSVIVGNSITASTSFSSTGSTFLGDETTDTISFGGRVNTDIIPILDADDDLGTNALRWDNIFGISVIANTVTASVSLSSTGNTFLGDTVDDNIFFGGQVATQMVFEEITVPGTPPANTITLYAKDDGGTSSLFFKDDAGAEFNLNATGGSGANTALSNLTTTSINQDLLPNSAGVFNLGSAALRWGNCFFGRIVFPTNTSPIAGDVNIVRNGDDMQYNVPTGSTFNWTFQSGSTQMELSSAELRLPGVNLDMENNSITDANQIQITGTSGDTIRGFLSGSAGLFDIAADENSGTIRMFAKTAGGASNNMVDIDGGTGLVGFGQGGITFGTSTNQPTITRSGDDLNYNVTSTAEINLQVGATDIINITSTDINIFQDFNMDNNVTVDWASTQSTVGPAGSADVLPNRPTSYIIIKVNGTEFVIPAFALS